MGFAKFGANMGPTYYIVITDIRRRTALTDVHRSFLRSIIKLNPKSASCNLKQEQQRNNKHNSRKITMDYNNG